MLDVAAETLIERLDSRRVCQRCGTPYNLKTNPPLKAGICDRCGEPLVRRSDDEPAVVRHRLAVYQSAIRPLQEYYRRQGCLSMVSGDSPPDHVATAVMAALPSHEIAAYDAPVSLTG
jgi:adenylate kinase